MTADRPWSRDDLLTVTEAAERLRIRLDDGKAIARRVAVHIPGHGAERVIWGDVLDLLRRGDLEVANTPTRSARLPRRSLG